MNSLGGTSDSASTGDPLLLPTSACIVLQLFQPCLGLLDSWYRLTHSKGSSGPVFAEGRPHTPQVGLRRPSAFRDGPCGESFDRLLPCRMGAEEGRLRERAPGDSRQRSSSVPVMACGISSGMQRHSASWRHLVRQGAKKKSVKTKFAGFLCLLLG